MFSQSKEEKEFFDKQNPIENTTLLSEREIQERQIKLLEDIAKSNNRIKQNIQFWFYLTIASILIGLLIIFNQ